MTSPHIDVDSKINRSTDRGDLKSDVRGLKATIRVSLDASCPMSILDETGSIRQVKHDDTDCTVEFTTDDLEAHCSAIEDRDGACLCPDDDVSREQEVVRITTHRPEECICSTIHRHEGTPQIEGCVDDNLIVTITFSDRDQLRAIISDLRDIADLVQVDALKETTSEVPDAPSTALDLTVLTATQRRFLELALEEGYFESPRGISQSELAEELGVSPSMVSRRVRSIEQRLFSQIESSLDVF